jgi:tetrahydromethanopterin S-methyltransferase subunit E
MILIISIVIYVVIGAFIAAVVKAKYSVTFELEKFNSPEGFLMFLGCLWPLTILGILGDLSFRFFYKLLTENKK